ncbi:hypothetical protein HD554DRAFT_312998 [Boletus coccyginus]|nr:hypothetical protein HD554DRAFT_312998 [Boletus coccyginus]
MPSSSFNATRNFLAAVIRWSLQAITLLVCFAGQCRRYSLFVLGECLVLCSNLTELVGRYSRIHPNDSKFGMHQTFASCRCSMQHPPVGICAKRRNDVFDPSFWVLLRATQLEFGFKLGRLVVAIQLKLCFPASRPHHGVRTLTTLSIEKISITLLKQNVAEGMNLRGPGCLAVRIAINHPRIRQLFKSDGDYNP